MNLHDSDETGVEIVCLRLFGVEDLHWVRSAWDGEDRCFIEILRELHSVQCGGCNDQLHVCALLYRLTNTNVFNYSPLPPLIVYI